MKLKLRFDSSDMKKFLIICLVLLYIVAVAISNLSSITSTGEFTGLNPIRAFSGDLLLSTIVFYFAALIALLVSCKSYFFEFDKGFGISTEKKSTSDGYSKWCDEKDMKKELKLVLPTDVHSNYAGVALINNGKKIYVDDSEFHNLVIGSTGSGKTTAIIYPMIELLSKHGESMIITDPKGELYKKKSNMLRAKGYKIILLNFREPNKGNAWNPLALPYKLWKNGNQDKAIELLEDLAANILYDESNKNSDPFWERTSADYFSGLCLALFEDATEDQINLNSISLMTTVGEEKIGGSTYIKEYFKTKDPNSPEYVSASSTILAPNDTKMSILAVFKQKIKLFASRAVLSEMLSYSDFNMEDIGREKTAVFIVIQDEKKTYHSLVTIFTKQVYETLIDVAQNNGGALPVRTNFLLDEFANMPPLKDVTSMITAARSRLMRFTMIIQNFAQLNEVYGEQNAETIKGNCGNMIYLISTELRALEEISKMCGEIKVKTGKDEKEKEETRPLITISDLQKLKMNEVIIRRLRMPPFKTKLTPDYKMDWGRKFKEADPKDIKPRETREVKVFNVKEYVTEKKKADGNNPFGGLAGSFPGAFPPNPFGSASGGFKPPFPGLFDLEKDTKNDTKPETKIDVDKILQNLDAKIAEIEAEEKRLSEEEKNAKDKIEKEENKLTELKQEKNVLPNEVPNIKVEIPKPRPEVLENNNLKTSDASKDKINFLGEADYTSKFDFTKFDNMLKNENSNINSSNKDINEKIETPPVENKYDTENSFKEFLDTFNDEDFKISNVNNDYKEEKSTPHDIDELINKIKEKSLEANPTNIKPNMDLKEENKYKEVSDDEFFDDFFDD